MLLKENLKTSYSWIPAESRHEVSLYIANYKYLQDYTAFYRPTVYVNSDIHSTRRACLIVQGLHNTIPTSYNSNPSLGRHGNLALTYARETV